MQVICKECKHYKPPPRYGSDRIVGEKGECHFGEIHRKVKYNESCCFCEPKS